MTCYIERDKNGNLYFICGDLGPHCAAERCGASSDFLCDYPVGNGSTCDASLRRSHTYEVANNVHYCPGHFQLWLEFKKSGDVTESLKDVTESLKNVISFNKGNKQ